MIKTAPSILSADFSRLGEEIEDVCSAGGDYLHFDVMDGIFVPNISFGIPILKSIRKITDMPLDVHLMIDRPIRYIESFSDAGADILSFHVEADSAENTKSAIGLIHSCGKKAGLAVKPATPLSVIYPFIDELDMVLVMTVEPGFGGQSFMADMLPKISELRDFAEKHGLSYSIETDGGINRDTAASAISAGADILVAGSAVFGSKDRAKEIELIKNAR